MSSIIKRNKIEELDKVKPLKEDLIKDDRKYMVKKGYIRNLKKL